MRKRYEIDDRTVKIAFPFPLLTIFEFSGLDSAPLMAERSHAWGKDRKRGNSGDKGAAGETSWDVTLDRGEEWGMWWRMGF